ncbi:hypothetical protein COV93_08245 [Candidatus Woesearchaeota archaeon CG11_big_fil_rev_8_21_14_0_20_43_8]|nr:MAG: hypothetical protein COV93_08245 [Candidatus Woesearchaeota archaeon CG11_big_fil_rev_8_21_14_0_20_43_8]
MEEEITEALARIYGGRVLDIGTGDGYFIDYVQRRIRSHDSVVAVDISKRIMELYKGRYGAKHVLMDSSEMAFADESFDTVTCSFSLHHFERLEDSLREMYRVLKTGGHLIVEEMYCDGNQTEAQQNHIDWHHWMAAVNRFSGLYHRETYKRDEIVSMMRQFSCVDQIDFYLDDTDIFDKSMLDDVSSTIEAYSSKITQMDGSEELIARGEAVRKESAFTGLCFPWALFLIGKK